MTSVLVYSSNWKKLSLKKCSHLQQARYFLVIAHSVQACGDHENEQLPFNRKKLSGEPGSQWSAMIPLAVSRSTKQTKINKCSGSEVMIQKRHNLLSKAKKNIREGQQLVCDTTALGFHFWQWDFACLPHFFFKFVAMVAFIQKWQGRMLQISTELGLEPETAASRPPSMGVRSNHCTTQLPSFPASLSAYFLLDYCD